VGEGAAECEDLDAGGGNPPDNEPGNPVVPTISLQAPKDGDVFNYGQDVRLDFSIEDGAGYDFCFVWCVDGPGVDCVPGTSQYFVGPLRPSMPSGVSFSFSRNVTLPATGDYNEFRTVLYGYPTGPRSCLDGTRHNVQGRVMTPFVSAAVEAATAVCGNGVVEEGEVCDHSGYACLIEPPRAGIPRYDVSRVTSGKWYKSGGSCERECTLLIPSSRFVREIVHDDITETDFCDRSNGPANTFCDVEDLFYDRPEGNPYSTGFRQVPCSATVKCNDTSSNQSNCAGGKP
jgi:hypothetical protein